MKTKLRITSKFRIISVLLVALMVGILWASSALAADYPPPPAPGDEGCSTDYWKNHLDAWGAIGLSPDDDFDATFGVDLFYPDITLQEALNLKGGGVEKLARHATEALLSVLHPDVNYFVTDPTEVIDLVRDGDADTLAELCLL